MRQMACGVVVILVAVLMTGCPPATYLEVSFPGTSQDFQVNDSNQLVLTIRFSEDIAFDSLIAGSNVILNTEDVTNASITIAVGATANEIVITSDGTVGDLLTFDPDGFFSIVLKATGGNPVESVDGHVLAGDYMHNYVLIG